jgi:DNA-binding SARP family transcriptional activator
MGHDVDARFARPRVCVLGPVRIAGENCDRLIRGYSARLLVDLIAASRPRTIEQLVESLWGDHPPPTFRAALHVHLGKLRGMLAEIEAGVTIRRDGERYLLDLGGAELDVRIAADVVTSAREQLARDPSAVTAALDSVLALWRGPAFEVDGEVIDRAAAHHADALRHEAEELLVESLLAAGDTLRAETTAAALVGAEPLRERRWGQLLRARYLAGRTADAIETYQEARRRLRELVGIDPGDELRLLEAAALTHDRVALLLPPANLPEPIGPPPTNNVFVARERPLRRVSERVASGSPVVILGPPGVGKSRLALEVAHRLEARAVAWVDLRDADLGAVVEKTSTWARAHPDGVVVYDNAESQPSVARAAADLQRRVPSLGVVLTSRVPLGDDLAVEMLEPLELPPRAGDVAQIEAAPAVVALRAAMEELAPASRMSSEDAAEVCRRAGGLPLAIRLAAAATRSLPASLIAESGVPAMHEEIDRAVTALCDVVGDPARTAFADLALVGMGFDIPLGAAVAATAPDDLAHVIVQLVDHGLLIARHDHSLPYSMLEPIREAADRMLGRGERRVEALSRYAEGCADFARRLALWAQSGRPGLADACAAALPRMREALDHLAQVRDAEPALAIACRLELPLYALGWWTELTELFDAALAIPGPTSARRARAHALRARPGPLHKFDLDHAALAEALAVDVGDPPLIAFARHIRAIGCWWHGDLDLSIALSTDAAAIWKDTRRTLRWCEATKFLGVARFFAGEVDGGLAMVRESLDTARRSGAPPFQIAHTLAYLGHCHRHLGDDRSARVDWTVARTLCRDVGNRGTAIHIQIGLADLDVDAENADDALSGASEALELIAESRSYTYESWAWTVALRSHAIAGDYGAAVACGRRAVDALPAGPPGETVRLAHELADLAWRTGDAEAAARLLGVAAATDDRREIPFVPPGERRRADTVARRVADQLGSGSRSAHDHGSRLSILEAAGDLLVPRGHGD